MASDTMAGSGPGRSARTLLVAAVAGACYLDFFSYRGVGAAAWDELLQGRGSAPQQYRVGVVWAAHWLSLHLHVAMAMAAAAIDGACALIAVMTLLRVLERATVYRKASATERWFGAAAFVLLMMWFIAWLLWLPRLETLPAAMVVALMLWLWQGDESNRSNAVLRSVALVGLSAFLAQFRADLACLLNVGIFVAVAVTSVGTRVALRRIPALFASSAGALVAAGVQLWLMRVVYPQANYGNVKLWQLWPNMHHATRWPPFVVFLLPLGWMAVQVVRHKFVDDAAGLAFAVGAALYGALWVLIGKIDEVRIFLPMAFALIPLTVQVAMLRTRSQQDSC